MIWLFYYHIVSHHFICTCIFPHFFTLNKSSDFLDLHIQVYICNLADQIFGEDHTPYKEPKFSYLIILSHFFLLFYSYRSLWFPILDSMLVLFLYSFVIMCGHLCAVAEILIYHSDYIACSDYLRLSAYIWDIFLAYMRRWLSSRLRSSVFWEAGRDKRGWVIVSTWLSKYLCFFSC